MFRGGVLLDALGLQSITYFGSDRELLFQMDEASKRRLLVIGGIVLLSAGAGLAYYLLSGKPKAYISSVRVYRSGEKVFVEAQAINVGRKKGCLKLQAVLVRADAGCPMGETGYDKDSLFWQIVNCVNQKNALDGFWGSWCGLPEGQGEAFGWKEVGPGQTVTLTAESWQTQHGYQFPSGIYHVYANVVPSPICDSADKIVKNGYFLWLPSQSL